MRLVVNCVFYNESEFLPSFLENLRKIRDLWAVELLDGSWKQEKEPTVNSTDNSKEIIENWKVSVPFEVNYIPSTKLWETESEKRNWLLDYTNKKYGDCWILVMDADEFVKFPSGLNSAELLTGTEGKTDCGIINVYGYNSLITLPSIRFIPSNKGIHYHTELAMIIHDKDCKLLCDYNPNREYRARNTWFYDGVFFVNHWTLRNNKRQIKKYFYQKWQKKQGVKECQWMK